MKPIAGSRLLVVEDDFLQLESLEVTLTGEGYRVRCAPNGHAALQCAHEDPPDLILLDVRLPDLDGIEVCRRLKADRLTAGIPVILLGAIDNVEAKLQGFTLGAVDWIAKPYAAEEVLIQVKAHLALDQQHRNLQRAVTESTEELARLNQRLLRANESLSAEIVQRQSTEQALRERLEFERLLSETSARFVMISPERLEEEIADCLQRILAFFEIDRCGMVRTLPGKNSFKIAHMAEVGSLPPIPAGVELPRSLFPWAYDRLTRRREAVVYARLDELPPEAAVDRQAWVAWGIRSNLNIPVIIADSADWVFSANQVRRERVWTEEVVQRFKLLGEILAGAIERSQGELALRESEERLNLAAAAAGAGIWVLSTATGEFWATPKGLEIFQYPVEAKPTFERLLALVHPDDRERVGAAVEQSRSNPDQLQIVEYRILHPDGSTRWVVSRGRFYPGKPGAAERIMGVTVDVTERKAMEETLRRRLEEIDALKLQLESENVYLREEMQLQHGHKEIVGRSAGMKKVLAKVEQVARTDATVLLQGETGTGKELLARTIHRLSVRRDRPLVTINCAVLPPSLIEGELFGRERGAYTGAMTRMAGRFELADRSTLFLDEIGELPLDLQAKLLRVIEEGRFERLGSTRPLQVDVRIVAATNRDLAQEVAAGRFRRDLYYRLNVFPISIPPLRERAEDVPPLVWAFVKQFEKKLAKRVEHIPRRSMEELQRYPWPGNARELRNTVESALITSEGGTLRLNPPRPVGDEIPTDATLEEIERRHIAKVLARSGGRISGRGGAAEVLGIKRTTLQSRMKKLGIRRSPARMPK